ncbi:MAG: hypothetical protein MUF81_08320 [Verrucomicrobia bacterium]|jgi:hypothetical protein|nr:hypothetical protein [Verrucomicrobiota bacterium]
MNDERPIEKLLRRYAKKRRDDAGAPIELHPATRRLLQGEVTRQFPKRSSAGDGEATRFARVLILWRRQLIWALPVLIVLGVGVWMLVGPSEKTGFEFDLAKNAFAPAAPVEVAESSFKALETPPRATPAPATSLGDQPTPAYAKSGSARDGVESSGVPVGSREDKFGVALKRETVRLKQGDAKTADDLAVFSKNETGLNLETSLVAANDFAQMPPANQLRGQTVEAKRALGAGDSAPTDDKSQAKAMALSISPKTDSVDNFDGIRKNYTSANNGSVAGAPASKVAELAPDASTKYFRQEARGGRQNNIQANSQAFANRAPVSSYGKTAKSATIVPVLANFQVEQTGDQLRVIDGDGSIYLGEVEAQPTRQSVAVAFEKKGAESLKGKQEDKLALGHPGFTQLPEQEAAQNFAYRVAGTNRTLNRQIVFTWNFVPLTNELAAAQIKASGRDGKVLQNNLPAQQFLLLLNNSFINGRAQLSGAKDIEINAVPVTP